MRGSQPMIGIADIAAIVSAQAVTFDAMAALDRYLDRRLELRQFGRPWLRHKFCKALKVVAGACEL